jgi:hypothetical protein
MLTSLRDNFLFIFYFCVILRAIKTERQKKIVFMRLAGLRDELFEFVAQKYESYFEIYGEKN